MPKISEVWAQVDKYKPDCISILEWHRTYEAIKLAVEYVGYIMITTKEQLDNMEIPKDKSGNKKKYSSRKIIVSKNGLNCKATSICDILDGTSQLLTKDELNVILQKVNDQKSINQPKGTTINNDKESDGINKLDELLKIDLYLDKKHLLEHRIADVAYCFKGSAAENIHIILIK